MPCPRPCPLLAALSKVISPGSRAPAAFRTSVFPYFHDAAPFPAIAVTPASYIDRHAADLLRRLRHMVGIPTVNPPGENYAPITAWLTRELAALGLKARRYPLPRALLRKSLPPEQHRFPRYNVLGKLPARGAKK